MKISSQQAIFLNYRDIISITSAIETQPHNNTGWINIVSPKKFKAHLDFGKVRVGIGIRAYSFNGAIPNPIFRAEILVNLNMYRTWVGGSRIS